MALDAGIAALGLAALFVILLGVGVALPESRRAIADMLPEFIFGTFSALMLALSTRPRGEKPAATDAPPAPPVTHYPPDETTGGPR